MSYNNDLKKLFKLFMFSLRVHDDLSIGQQGYFYNTDWVVYSLIVSWRTYQNAWQFNLRNSFSAMQWRLKIVFKTDCLKW